jgi:Ca2+-binding RTX toxin-like protein
MRLDDDIFTGLGTPAGSTLNAAAFVANASGSATAAAHRIVYNTSNGELYYDADGNAAGLAVLFATLDGAPSISASDFFVIG